MSEEIELLRKIHDLLLLIAEPQLAERDRARRDTLQNACGKSKKKRAAIFLMDGSRTQTQIATAGNINAGQLSNFMKQLRDDELLDKTSDNPKLAVSIPADFFERSENAT